MVNIFYITTSTALATSPNHFKCAALPSDFLSSKMRRYHYTETILFTSRGKETLLLFGSAVKPVFDRILNFFFLLKLNAVCIFWIVLMC
jgi:hypothetical protein